MLKQFMVEWKRNSLKLKVLKIDIISLEKFPSTIFILTTVEKIQIKTGKHLWSYLKKKAFALNSLGWLPLDLDNILHTHSDILAKKQLFYCKEEFKRIF